MTGFAAVEVKAGERDAQAIERFCVHANDIGLKFEFLVPYGPLTIGSTTFIRFETDCPRLEALIQPFLDEPRALIVPGKAGYRMISRASEGTVPIARMQATRLPGYTRRWRGTANRFWTRQFAS